MNALAPTGSASARTNRFSPLSCSRTAYSHQHEPRIDADQALIELGRDLKESGYRFITITPASHRRVITREGKPNASLEDIFGWSRPFRESDFPPKELAYLKEAGELEAVGSLLRSRVRFSTLGNQLFVHSAFPTEQADAVFFGPDTYRFARLIRDAVANWQVRHSPRILDIGAGSGAGGLYASALLGGVGSTVVLTDVNPRALRFGLINASLNDIARVKSVESNLFAEVHGCFDLIISNPPYLVDSQKRVYRHGGGELGSEISLKIIEEGIDRLAPGGRLVLYTGSAIIAGEDKLHHLLTVRLAGRPIRFAYEEIDPDVFGEELDHPPYDRADRIAVVGITIDAR